MITLRVWPFLNHNKPNHLHKKTRQHGGTKKRGFLEGGFCKMYASLGCGALSAKCIAGANVFGYFFVSFSAALDYTETPFAKTPFSRFLTTWRNITPRGQLNWTSPICLRLDRANGRGGFGCKLLLTPSEDPPNCGYCDSISQNAHPASTFELFQCRHCKERLLGPDLLFQSCQGTPCTFDFT